MEQIPLVSCLVIAYKHAPYLRTCLDSLLGQVTEFPFEVIVGDDCSNDGSAEILREYQEKYPDNLIVIINEKNLGASQNGKKIRSYSRGKYIASCEGDDFWCDDYKLQKQVDYLETHPEIEAVGSNYYFVDINGGNKKRILRKGQTNRVYHLKDYLYKGFLIHGNTLVRRVHPELEKDEKYMKLREAVPTMGDVISRILIYDRGGIYVFPEPMLCHRDGSAVASSFSAQNKTKAVYYSEMYAELIHAIEEYYDGRYDLSSKIASRLASVFLGKVLGKTCFDMKSFFSLLKKQTFKTKCLFVLELCYFVIEGTWNKFYWMFHDRAE